MQLILPCQEHHNKELRIETHSDTTLTLLIDDEERPRSWLSVDIQELKRAIKIIEAEIQRDL